MATVVFVWELGDGFGHLVRYRPLIERLAAAGHRVVFHAAAEARAQQVFADLPVEVRPAPRGTTRRPDLVPSPNSFAEVLWNTGYAEVEAVAARLAHWRQVFQTERPAVVIADYAPSAVIACRVLGVRCIAAGNGFYVPVRCSPLPPYRRVHDGRAERAILTEQKLLAVLDAATRRLGAHPTSSVADAVMPPETFLLTFPEFDPMAEHRDAATEYLGAWPSDGFGSRPEFPDGRTKVFCYVDVNKMPERLWRVLEQSEAGVVVVNRAGNAAPRHFLNKSNVKVMQNLADLTSAAHACDAGVTSGALNSTLALLLAGKPVLAMPVNLEQYLNATRLERAGAGLAAPATAPGDLEAKFGALLADRDLRRGARRFAARHGSEDAATTAERMLARLSLPPARPEPGRPHRTKAGE